MQAQFHQQADRLNLALQQLQQSINKNLDVLYSLEGFYSASTEVTRQDFKQGVYTRDLLERVEIYQQQYPKPTPEVQAKLQEIDLEFINEDLPKILKSMNMGAERIRQIVLSLRNFSRLDEAEMKSVDIHQGIDSTLMILDSRLKPQPGFPGIQVIKKYGNLPLVECWAGQLNQVFMNVLSNAFDFLYTKTHILPNGKNSSEAAFLPTIRIRTELLSSNCVCVRIADNGAGMMENVKKMFV
ncbi:hypothetical protein [Microcoleus sp. S13_B4]|uniref:hypothetical protein n=1 Tax=Microcoleus sp. S13_B4 TaxID=3055408 RepID=UPI002FCF38FF